MNTVNFYLLYMILMDPAFFNYQESQEESKPVPLDSENSLRPNEQVSHFGWFTRNIYQLLDDVIF